VNGKMIRSMDLENLSARVKLIIKASLERGESMERGL